MADLNLEQIAKLLGQLQGGNNDKGNDSDFQGFEARDIRPRKRPVYASKNFPVLTLKKVIGLASGNTNFYTTVKFYIQKPTLEYPETAVKLSLQGAKSSVFTMLSIDEVGELMSFFEKCYKEGAEVVEGYKALQEKLKAKKEEMQKDEQNIFTQYAPQIAEVLEKSDIVGE